MLDGPPELPALMPLAAAAGEPVTVDTVLAALFEMSSSPAYRNLVFHDSHYEQTDAALAEQVRDLYRLAEDTPRVADGPAGVRRRRRIAQPDPAPAGD